MSRNLVYFVILLLALSASGRNVKKEVSRQKIRISSRSALSPQVSGFPVISWASNDVSKVFGFWSDRLGKRFDDNRFIRIQMKAKRVKRVFKTRKIRKLMI